MAYVSRIVAGHEVNLETHRDGSPRSAVVMVGPSAHGGFRAGDPGAKAKRMSARLAVAGELGLPVSKVRAASRFTRIRATTGEVLDPRTGRVIGQVLPPTNNPALRAQVRRLPSGEVQLKIPLSRNPASLKAAMKAVRKLGRRVKSVVVTGMKRGKRHWNPNARPFYTIKKSDIGKATIKAFGRRWSVVDVIGHIGPYDIGKRVIQTSPGVLQVENDAQMRRRLGF